MAKDEEIQPKNGDEESIEQVFEQARADEGEGSAGTTTMFMQKGPRNQLQHILNLCVDNAREELDVLGGLGLPDERKADAEESISGIKATADAEFNELPAMISGKDRDAKAIDLGKYSGILLEQCAEIDKTLRNARTACQGHGNDYHKAIFMAHYESAIRQIEGERESEKGRMRKMGLSLSEEDRGAYRIKLDELRNSIEGTYESADSTDYAMAVMDANSEIDSIMQEARALRKQAVNGKARARLEEDIPEGYASLQDVDEEEADEEEGEGAPTETDMIQQVMDETAEEEAAREEEQALEEEVAEEDEEDRQKRIFAYTFEARFNANMEDYRRATVFYQEVEKLDPENKAANDFLESEEASPYLGMTLDQLKAAEEQEFNDNFQEAFRLATDASFYRNMGDYEQATAAYQALLAVSPGHAEAKDFLASEHAKPYLEAPGEEGEGPAQEYDPGLFETQRIPGADEGEASPETEEPSATEETPGLGYESAPEAGEDAREGAPEEGSDESDGLEE